MQRREFLAVTACAVVACSKQIPGLRLEPDGTLGGLKTEAAPTPIPDAKWFTAEKAGDGLSYTFPAGKLAKAKMLTSDMLLDGNHKIVFRLTLREGEDGRQFHFRFSGLNQCSLRMRMPLSLVDQNRWGIDREGAFLKPRVSGARVDLAKVDRMTLTVMRKSPATARWCMTDLIAADEEVPLLDQVVLPKGKLIDEVGQSTIHSWPAKSKSVDEVCTHIQAQFEAAPKQSWPAEFSKWGGWKSRQLMRPAGFFRTHHDGKRWWLVDPDGYAFWSSGLDCIRVDTLARYDGLESALEWLPEGDPKYSDMFPGYSRGGKYLTYLAANFIRALGPESWRQKWADVALSEMKRMRFNTVGNWSEWEFARAAQFPYVRPMSFEPKRISRIYRDFPDVFHADFANDAADYAAQLNDTADDPALIGYFLMNEPTWGFSSELPAAGMLYVTEECSTRTRLAEFLKQKYPDDAALSGAWGLAEASLDQIARGKWTGAVLTDEANADLREFSVQMAKHYFETLTDACRKADPNHLNLGMRWAGIPPEWAVEGMRSFDVFSMNCYRNNVPRDVTDRIHEMLEMPVIIGEWHFGALDVGLPSSGIGHLKNQADRAKAYRVYIEDAAANPNCVGTHWFTLYDQSALGRFDGENYQIGFLDVCNKPYKEMSEAAIASHESIYDIATGRTKPFDDVPEYLPKLF